MAKSKEELKSFLMKVNEESEEVGLKLSIQKTKIMASVPITSWQIDGETMETATDFIFLGSRITADGDCSHEIKRHLPLGRKVMINLDSILKSREITLLTNVCLVKAMVFPVVLYGCEKKTEHQRTDAFELWCWRRLESPLDSKEIKPVSPKGNQSWYSLEGLKLKPQYFGHLMQRTDSLEKILMLGKIEGGRRREQRMRWLDGTWVWSCSRSWETWCAAVHGVAESDMTEWLNWTKEMHCGISWHFSKWLILLSIFSSACCHLYIFFGKVSVKISCSF